MQENFSGHIVFFDSDCLLCQSSVRFICKHDQKNRFYFASLESEIANKLLPEGYLQKNTVVLYTHVQIFVESDAVLQILRHLGGTWFIMYTVLSVVPSGVRNLFYQYIAKNRYAWFGKSNSCFLPRETLASKFL